MELVEIPFEITLLFLTGVQDAVHNRTDLKALCKFLALTKMRHILLILLLRL